MKVLNLSSLNFKIAIATVFLIALGFAFFLFIETVSAGCSGNYCPPSHCGGSCSRTPTKRGSCSCSGVSYGSRGKMSNIRLRCNCSTWEVYAWEYNYSGCSTCCHPSRGSSCGSCGNGTIQCNGSCSGDWCPPPPDPEEDIGLRMFDGTNIVTIAAEPSGTLTSPLRIAKGGTIYGIILVDVTDSDASKIRIETNSGIKALKKL